jgi:hypothetical protein
MLIAWKNEPSASAYKQSHCTKKELLLATQYRDCHGPELNEPITSEGGIDAERTSKTATLHKTEEERRAIQVDPERRVTQLVQNWR